MTALGDFLSLISLNVTHKRAFSPHQDHAASSTFRRKGFLLALKGQASAPKAPGESAAFARTTWLFALHSKPLSLDHCRLARSKRFTATAGVSPSASAVTITSMGKIVSNQFWVRPGVPISAARI